MGVEEMASVGQRSSPWHVMISSTMNDLQVERKTAYDVITEAGLAPWWAENPPALFAGEPREFCRRMAEQCDLFLLILGPRYGYTPEGQIAHQQRSVTQMELEWARAESGRKVRIFIHTDALQTADVRQRAFITEVQRFESGLMRFPPFTTTDQLAQQVREAVQDWLAQQDVGIQLWLRDVRTRYATFLNPLTGQHMATDDAVVLQLRTEHLFSRTSRSAEGEHAIRSSDETVPRDQPVPNALSQTERFAASQPQDSSPSNRKRRRQIPHTARTAPMLVGAAHVTDESARPTPLSAGQEWPSETPSDPSEPSEASETASHIATDSETNHLQEPDGARAQPLVGSVSELLDRFERFVLVGEPGSGKSTLLRRLAYDLAVGALASSSARLRLPIYLPAVTLGAMLAQRAAPTLPETFAEYAQTAGNAAGLPAAGVSTIVLAVTSAVREGNAVILVDGLDEARSDSRRMIVQLLQAAGGNWVILSTRPQATEYASLSDWHTCFVEQLDAERRRELIRRAIEAVPPDLQGQLALENLEREIRRLNPNQEIHVTLDAAVADLEHELNTRPDLSSWAGNPLLLTLIATQYALTWRLPEERARIYAFAIEELLDQRRSNAIRQMTSADLQRMLQDLALAMTEANVVTASYEDLYALLSAGDNTIVSTYPRFVDELLARTALIQQQSPGHWGFVHLTFQEYLTACALADLLENQRHTVLLRHRLSARWEQVYLLLISILDLRGEGGKQAVDHMILALIAGDRSRVAALGGTDPTHTALVLATRCQASRMVMTRRSVDVAIQRQWRREWRRTVQSMCFPSGVLDFAKAFDLDRFVPYLGEIDITAGIITADSSPRSLRRMRRPKKPPQSSCAVSAVVYLGLVALLATLAVVAGQPTVAWHVLLRADAAAVLVVMLMWWIISRARRWLRHPETVAFELLIGQVGSLGTAQTKLRWLNNLWRIRDAEVVSARRTARHELYRGRSSAEPDDDAQPLPSKDVLSMRIRDDIAAQMPVRLDHSTIEHAIQQLVTLGTAGWDTKQQVLATFEQLDHTFVEFLPNLVAALRDGVDGVRELAAFAIGQLGSAAAPAVPALIDVIRRGSSEAATRAAIQALGKIGPAALSAEQVLLDSVRDPTRRDWHGRYSDEATIEGAALHALFQMGPGALPAISSLASDPDCESDLRYAIIRGLGQAGAPAIPHLRAFLSTVRSPDLYITDVVRALGSIGPEALPSLITLLETVKPPVPANPGPVRRILFRFLSRGLVPDARLPILNQIGKLGPIASPALASIVPLLADRNVRIRRAAAEVVQRSYSANTSVEFDPVLLRRALRDRDDTVREVVALLAINHPGGRRALARLRAQASNRIAAVSIFLRWVFALVLILPPALAAFLLLVKAIWPAMHSDLPASAVGMQSVMESISRLFNTWPSPNVFALFGCGLAYILAVVAALAIDVIICGSLWNSRMSAVRALSLVVGDHEDTNGHQKAHPTHPHRSSSSPATRSLTR